MIKRNSFLPPALLGIVLLSGSFMAGCGDKPDAATSPCPPANPACMTEPSPAAGTSTATNADSKMGPPPPPPTQAPPDGPTPFKGTGKIVKDDSGLKYEDMTVGTGPSPKEGQYVLVQYVGTSEDGTEFDSSFKHGGTFEFQLGAGNVIKGWDLGVAKMKIGGRRKYIIPGNLAYGAAPPPGAPFKPNETLTFDITLLSASDQATKGGM